VTSPNIITAIAGNLAAIGIRILSPAGIAIVPFWE
jgi:hypothetical protein